MYLEHLWKLYGFPTSILSDTEPQFTSGFWPAAPDWTLSIHSHSHPDRQDNQENQLHLE